MDDYLGRQILQHMYRDRRTNEMVVRVEDIAAAFEAAAQKFGAALLMFSEDSLDSEQNHERHAAATD